MRRPEGVVICAGATRGVPLRPELGGVFMLMTLAVFVAYAYASATVRELVLGTPAVLRCAPSVRWNLLIGLAARLALMDR